jgi:acyl-CoA thioesterase II
VLGGRGRPVRCPAVDPLDFFGLEPTDEPGRWLLPVELRLCSGLGALFGGAALGAAVAVLEAVTDRPATWASCQFLGFARPPATVAIEVEVLAAGRRTSQARATGRTLEGAPVFAVQAALGGREARTDRWWGEPPVVPPAERCPPRVLRERQAGTIGDVHMELRPASGPLVSDQDPPLVLDAADAATRPAMRTGRTALWARCADLGPSSALLGLLGDVVLLGVSEALGRRVGGTSLDNTVRFARLPPATGWVLLDVAVSSVAAGFVHGRVHLWSEDGTFLGTASQTGTLHRGAPPGFDAERDGLRREGDHTR